MFVGSLYPHLPQSYWGFSINLDQCHLGRGFTIPVFLGSIEYCTNKDTHTHHKNATYYTTIINEEMIHVYDSSMYCIVCIDAKQSFPPYQ
jgi:hypothetical protein